MKFTNIPSIDSPDVDPTQLKIKESIMKNVDDVYLQENYSEDVSQNESYDTCSRCEINKAEHTITIEDKKWEVCTHCRNEMESNIERFTWFERFNRGHYQIVSAYLQALDPIECVHDNAYEGGEMWVHTKYATTEVVGDIIEYFGVVYAAGIERKEDSNWDCVNEKGTMFEIGLDFTKKLPHNILTPRQLAIELYSREYRETDYIDNDDKLF